MPHPESAFAALHKLPPAHTLTWADGRVQLRRYWKLSYASGPIVNSKAEREQLLREQLLEATRLRLRSDVPLGAFLSGGVDSSAIVAAMAREASGQVKTFSIGFDADEFDETPYAREIAELFDTDHHELRVEPNAMEILPRLVWHYGEPFADGSAIPSFYLAELTRRHVTVALNGDGGDESFAGYRRYVAYQMMQRLGHLPRPLWRLAAALSGRMPDRRGGLERARERESRLMQTMPMRPVDRHRVWMTHLSRSELDQLYTPEFADSLDTSVAARALGEAYADSDADNAARAPDRHRCQHLPSWTTPREGGHRHHGQLARGSLAAARPSPDGNRRRTPRLGQGARLYNQADF